MASGRSGLAVVPAPEVQRRKMGKETGLDAAPLRSLDPYFWRDSVTKDNLSHEILGETS